MNFKNIGPTLIFAATIICISSPCDAQVSGYADQRFLDNSDQYSPESGVQTGAGYSQQPQYEPYEIEVVQEKKTGGIFDSAAPGAVYSTEQGRQIMRQKNGAIQPPQQQTRQQPKRTGGLSFKNMAKETRKEKRSFGIRMSDIAKNVQKKPTENATPTPTPNKNKNPLKFNFQKK